MSMLPASFGVPIPMNTSHLEGNILICLDAVEPGIYGNTNLGFVDILLSRFSRSAGMSIDFTDLRIVAKEEVTLELEHEVLAEIMSVLGSAFKSEGISISRTMRQIGECSLVVESPVSGKSAEFYISPPGQECQKLLCFSKVGTQLASNSGLSIMILACWMKGDIIKDKFFDVWLAIGEILGDSLRKER